MVISCVERWYRRLCCRPLSLCGRETVPTDPWFSPTRKSFAVDASEELSVVKAAIISCVGRIKPRPFFLLGTSDAGADFDVVRDVEVDDAGTVRLCFWGAHVDRVTLALRDLRGADGRRIPVTPAIDDLTDDLEFEIDDANPDDDANTPRTALRSPGRW